MHKRSLTCAAIGMFVVVVSVMVLAQPVVAAAGQFTEYPLNSTPGQITVGPDGNVWFLEPSFQLSTIVRMTPAGQMTAFPLPLHQYAETITTGPDGNLWFGTNTAVVGKITPTGQITEFTVSPSDIISAITVGPDGNLWFTGSQEIGRVTPAGVVTTFDYFQVNNAQGITAGPDGKLWFVENSYFVAYDSIDPITGHITRFLLASGNPTTIIRGPAGDPHLWLMNGHISEIDPATGQIIRTFAATGGELLASQGALWFTTFNAIGEMNLTGTVTLFPTPPPAVGAQYLAADAGGTIWFTTAGSQWGTGIVGSMMTR